MTLSNRVTGAELRTSTSSEGCPKGGMNRSVKTTNDVMENARQATAIDLACDTAQTPTAFITTA